MHRELGELGDHFHLDSTVAYPGAIGASPVFSSRSKIPLSQWEHVRDLARIIMDAMCPVLLRGVLAPMPR